MYILGIETSCDDTGIAILDQNGQILSNILASQIKIHAPYGGVVPNLAARAHLKNIKPCLDQAFSDAKISEKDIKAIAITVGPGLIPSLLVGVSYAKALAYRWNKPLIPINHMEGHIYANWLKEKDIELPAVVLTVSGGHTQLILMKKHGHYDILGETRDDAAGEAFDKAAKLLGLGYPGGPIISQRALEGDPKSYDLPRPMIRNNDFDFSFSGLKTSLLYKVQKIKKMKKETVNNFCASFEQAIVDVLVKKSQRAVLRFKPKSFLLSGGVAANEKLRETLKKEIDCTIYMPERKFCTDNGAMIAQAALFKKDYQLWSKVQANANLKL